ncbi:unnamed protein product, partial [Symbiodinium necroappetens]
FLLFFDISEKDRGPFFVGDICMLYHEHQFTEHSLIWAPRHLEYARWGHTVLSTDVLLLHLDGLRKRTLAQLFSEVPQDTTSNTTTTLYPVGIFRDFLAGWLNHLYDSQSSMVNLLPPTWWFVPYEQWLFDMSLADLLSSHFRSSWLPVMHLREYPGFQGSKPELRIACPSAASAVPIAIRHSWPDILQRYAYAVSWKTRLGPNFCNRAVQIMSLQWERADRPPVIPFQIRELPWVA